MTIMRARRNRLRVSRSREIAMALPCAGVRCRGSTLGAHRSHGRSVNASGVGGRLRACGRIVVAAGRRAASSWVVVRFAPAALVQRRARSTLTAHTAARLVRRSRRRRGTGDSKPGQPTPGHSAGVTARSDRGGNAVGAYPLRSCFGGRCSSSSVVGRRDVARETPRGVAHRWRRSLREPSGSEWAASAAGNRSSIASGLRLINTGSSRVHSPAITAPAVEFSSSNVQALVGLVFAAIGERYEIRRRPTYAPSNRVEVCHLVRAM